MDQTHIHLLVNHFPVIGSILGSFVLVYGLIVKSTSTKKAAFLIFILCAIGAGITYGTGEGAEETAEHITGISEIAIEQHEEAAKAALIGMIVLGLVAITALIVSVRTSAVPNYLTFVLLVVAATSFGITAYAANLGGKIRHTEIANNSGSAIISNHSGQEHDD